MAKINPDMDAHKLNADREEVWAEVLDWHRRQIATPAARAELLALFDLLQLEGPTLRDAVNGTSDVELDVISRLATAAMSEAAYRDHCEVGDDDGE